MTSHYAFWFDSDASPPVIKDCPDSFTVYADIDGTALVTYSVPHAEDKSDGHLPTTMEKGYFN